MGSSCCEKRAGPDMLRGLTAILERDMTYKELTDRVISGARNRNVRRACALAVPVAGEGEDLSVLLEVRASTLDTQPGEVCLPGGGVEPGETPEEAALRELEEELGIRARLGPALDREIGPAGLLICPFLVRLEPGWETALRPSAAEVEEAFTVPLDFFRTTPPEVYRCVSRTEAPADFPYEKIGFPGGYPWRERRFDVPIWMWEGRPIWGLTARVLRGLAERL